MPARTLATATMLSALLLTPVITCGEVRLVPIPGQAELGTIEIHGVAAGEFDPAIWQADTLHILPDVRHPMLAPRLSGGFRNIYAPSPVEIDDGWRLFYGAWDGVLSGNDRIYSRDTRDFVDFGEARTEIEHGTFIHVCNVNTIRLPDKSFRMVCTAYPDAKNLNKPAVFSSPDGRTWNGTPAPHAAGAADLITIEGYEPFAAADMNGVNVLLHDGDKDRLYFGNFTAHGHVHHATATDAKHFRYDGVCLDTPHMVNDVRPFTHDGKTWYLMGLHANGDRLWYALSTDGMKFDAERELVRHVNDADRFIVAIGWVTHGNRVLGCVCGAGEVSSLNRNRLFGRWLQKRLVFTTAAGETIEPDRALGPDRQVVRLPAGETQARLEVFADDGRTPLGQTKTGKLTPGAMYRVEVTP